MPHSRQASNFLYCQHKQRGAALMVMLVIMIIGSAAFLVRSLSKSGLQIEHDKKTVAALAQAKEALIGFSTSVNLGSGSRRPGDLPCPDMDNDGIPGDATYTTCNLQYQRIGRLPWKTLGLPDLRDGSGERLWYAVSTNFKNSTRSGTLNSDTPGTISIFAPDGTQLNDGGGSSGVVAVIIAPGDVLQRQDSVSQTRGCTVGVDCDTTDKCISASPTTVPKCNPVNYLDIATVGGNTENNASFSDGSSSIGFIQGRIKDSNGNLIVNDQLLVITQDNIMQPIQKRVAAEVKQCLNEYASKSQNKGRYPWAARVRPTSSPSYGDRTDYLFGRVPDTSFGDTRDDSGGEMDDSWTGNCNINSASGWWLNWKEMVFYGLADAYKPVDPLTAPAANACDTAGVCLKVNPPSVTANKKFVVIVAGKKLPGQFRVTDTDKGTFSNYLEAPNPTPSYTGSPPNPTDFSQAAPTTMFNDTVVFQ